MNPYAEAVKKAEEEEKRARQHTIIIYARGCETTRDCYCLSTNGFIHNEYESPWVVNMDGDFERGGKEQPPEPAFLPGEDLEEYRERMARAEAWGEGFSAGLSHDIRIDNGYAPEPNPYLDEKE